MKLLIAFKSPTADNPDACHKGLGVTSGNTAETLTEYGVPAIAAPVVDGYYLRDHLRAGTWGAITHVILSAPFFDTAFLSELCAAFPDIRFVVVFHSNVGFLAVDNWSTKVLAEQSDLQCHVRNFIVGANCEKFRTVVERAFGTATLLLPNLYFLHGPIQRERALWSSGTLRVGCFGALRILKNIPTAAWAARIMARKLGVPVEFHISEGRAEGAGAESIIGNLAQLFAGDSGVELICDRWSDWLNFRRSAVRGMHILMQPSFTESFNGVTADGIAEGVPSVVSEAIDWVPAKWIANADDAADVADVAMALLRDKNAARDGYQALKLHNERGIADWRAYLQNWKG